ncbi:hypothetical protein LOB47_03035 [Lactobacillus delbrueckii subsp. lactis]|nr:hypothetical protein [Lactobacillus delbrueckii]MCD5576462.1 hypothetical protein [Lactobacillus delbrueckii subsp. lactis]MCD5603312.1 hypothetical protein [Lactobacillus delbrueckii subsp. lactis]MCD5605792.1 hypothetical protein [Lactobacillus delbrueckii subsp. lactis]
MNIDANDIIAKYRKLVDDLQYNLLLMQAQVEQLHKELQDVKANDEQD